MFLVFKMFQRYVASASNGCCKSRSWCCICCKCFIWMLQALSKCFICCRRNLASVLIWMLHMLQEYVSNDSVLRCRMCFHVTSCKCLSRSCICCNHYRIQLLCRVPQALDKGRYTLGNGYTHMLQVYISNVSAVFKSMLQVFYLNIAYVAGYTHMLHAYVSSV